MSEENRDENDDVVESAGGVEESGETGEDAGEEIPVEIDEATETSRSKPRERLSEEADRAVEQFDERLVDLLSWVLDTETRARIYVYLRQHPGSTSEEIAEGTGLYPSTVREALAALHDEETVNRRKRESEGAGNNPYEYTAIAPSELVGGVIGQIQDELNTLINLDSHLGRDEDAEYGTNAANEPVTINVDEEPELGSSADYEESDDEDGGDEDEPDWDR